MGRIRLILIVALILGPSTLLADDRVMFLNAFGETATAYLNDSFLLLGTTADGFVADILPKETALEIAKNVQKRVRVIRGKLKAVAGARLSGVDKQLIDLLDNSYGCMDHQAWALYQYVEDKSPDAARRFEAQRSDCLESLKKVADFYSALPPSPEVPEPLSTR
ncbi:MAG: hypothetical protein HY913_08720 [Desulfomonile tiedjei]|nr:hypothetical protein [Desulfomonile tiedjei]